MKQTNLKTLQKNLKADLYKYIMKETEEYGLAQKPLVQIQGRINRRSHVVVTVKLEKPRHMCSKEEYSYDDYTAEQLASRYDDILNYEQYSAYPYETEPVSDSMRDMCSKIETKVLQQCSDVFDSFEVIVAVLFKSKEELEDPWKEEKKTVKKWLKENKDMTPAELNETAQSWTGENKKVLWYKEDEVKEKEEKPEPELPKLPTEREYVRSLFAKRSIESLKKLVRYDEKWTQEVIAPYEPHEFMAFTLLEEKFDSMKPFHRAYHLEIRHIKRLLDACESRDDIDIDSALKAYGEGVPIDDIIA